VSNPVVLINARDVAEAVAAAQALTPDLDQQVEITAGLMGLSPDEAKQVCLVWPTDAGCDSVV
jgi:hypothetical protein